jgi:hypothetical protein
LDTVNDQVHVFYVQRADSSHVYNYNTAAYQKSINYLKADLDFNILTGPKRLINYSGGSEAVPYNKLGMLLKYRQNRLVLVYSVTDTMHYINHAGTSIANKLLITDLNGQLVDSKYLGWPISFINDAYFYNHHSLDNLIPINDLEFMLGVSFFDSVFETNKMYNAWMVLDSNLDYKGYYPRNATFPRSGSKLRGFGGATIENHFKVPSGSVYRVAFGSYMDSSYRPPKELYNTAIGKALPHLNYMTDTMYLAPGANDIQDVSFRGKAKQAGVYNPFDNKIYLYLTTHSNYMQSNYCINNQSSLGQLICLDTNLQEQWVKYIHYTQGGNCQYTMGVQNAYQQEGVFVAGVEYDTNLPFGLLSNAHSYIYFVDSMTSSSIHDDKDAGMVIRALFELYPNPTKDFFEIDHVLGKAFDYQIYDAQGRLMTSGQSLNGRKKITTASWSQGMYVVRVFDDHSIQSIKVIKD